MRATPARATLVSAGRRISLPRAFRALYTTTRAGETRLLLPHPTHTLFYLTHTPFNCTPTHPTTRLCVLHCTCCISSWCCALPHGVGQVAFFDVGDGIEVGDRTEPVLQPVWATRGYTRPLHVHTRVCCYCLLIGGVGCHRPAHITARAPALFLHAFLLTPAYLPALLFSSAVYHHSFYLLTLLPSLSSLPVFLFCLLFFPFYVHSLSHVWWVEWWWWVGWW